MAEPAAGRLVFAHNPSFFGRCIRFGERLRGVAGSQWNHVGIIDHELPTGDWAVVEAEARGVVTGRLSDIAKGGSHEVVALAGAETARVLAFARMQIGDRYGWLSIATIVVNLLTPRWFHLPSVRSRRTWICSALGAEGARAGGWLHDWPDIYDVMPSELYAALPTKGTP